MELLKLAMDFHTSVFTVVAGVCAYLDHKERQREKALQEQRLHSAAYRHTRGKEHHRHG